MEREKRLRSESTEKRGTEKSKPETKHRYPEKSREKDKRIKEELQERKKIYRGSKIPLLKRNKNLRCVSQKKPSIPSSFCCSCARKGKSVEEYKLKLQKLEEKEKSIAEYYLKIENMLRKMTNQKKSKQNDVMPIKFKSPRNSFARKMTSDSSVISKSKSQDDILSDFESSIKQISDIWLKTSVDLSKTFKNFKNYPMLDPMEFEMENVKIQLAIKQAKSLTLVKTRNVIAEAQKFFRRGKMIRTELEKLLSNENLNSDGGNYEKTLKKEERVVKRGNSENKETDGSGDSTKGSDLENTRETTSGEASEKEMMRVQEDKPVKKCSCLEGKLTNSDETSESQTKPDQFSKTSSDAIALEVETLAAELAKKNETITNLNNRVFELQKACNEHLLKYNQLQVKLSEFNEKTEWNQILWKQIDKLKKRILELQQSNKQLEAHKKELKCKITKLDKELERLIRLNHFLNQRKYLLETCSGIECRIGNNATKVDEEKWTGNAEYRDDSYHRIISEKQNAINQLKSILNTMKGQENFAQQQIDIFQSKIEALEK